ncbi:SDR family oxidoreductase [Rhodobacteraceae bacterium NNCM2]|nr:SDR family oxidoreductase [Coraliihabitans acroporae]
MQTDLTGQNVVLTGITGGIARATAARLLSLGATLHVTARSRDKLDAALQDMSGPVTGHVMDLRYETSIAATFEAIGAFDHLVTPAATGMFAPIAEMDFAAAREILETKQWGQMLCAHYGAKHIARTGSITLFSGTVTQKPLAGATMFAAVGAATEAAARIWGLELAPVRVNTVVPGVIDTGVWGDILGDEAAEATLAAIGGALPVGRIGTPDEIAKAVVFLIDNAFVNGLSLVVDGGHRLV